MIRKLADCPYCQKCEVALTDNLAVAFNPEQAPPLPCPHLIWIEGRYSQWERSPLPGRKTKIARIVGSTEFEWQHPGLVVGDDAHAIQAYLKELVTAGGGWELAPSERHTVRVISADHNVSENGKSYPDWEIEGTALFADNPLTFIESLPASQARWSAAWKNLPGTSPS